MEINEVLRRVILRHIRILFLCTLLGALASMALFTSRTPVYRASARVALGGWDPNDATKAKTLVDSARSVANSDRVVRAAIASAKVHRSIADVAATISVSASGSTSVVDVAVTDSDPKVAAKLADGLATTMIAVRSDLIRGQIQSLVADVDKRMAAQIALVSKFEGAARKAAPGSEQAAIALKQYDSAVQQRTGLETERYQLLSLGALQPRAAVIDTAAIPTTREGSGLAPQVALGVVAGLLVGFAISSMIEVLRPTVSGPDAIARAAGGPWLGTLSGAPGPMLNGQMEAAAGGIRLAAASANVGTVLVVPAGTDHRDAEEVASVLGVAPDEGSEPDPSLLEPVPGGARAVVSYDNANSGGIVVVAPDSIRRRDLAAVHHWSAATHWPVLGVVLYPHGWLARARHRAAQSANGNGNGKANGNGNGKANANGNGRKEHIPTA